MCSKLVFVVLKELLATKSVPKKTMSGSAIGKKNRIFSVITMVWLECRAFVVECSTKTESYVTVQHAFPKNLN